MKESNNPFTLKKYSTLFGGPEITSSMIVKLPLSELHEKKNHPFRVIHNAAMDELADSIADVGILTPAIVRSAPGGEDGYEILAGHRRKMASELAHQTTMPCIIRECDDATAIRIMVHTNIQREDLLPSEKAHAYQMDYEARRHQGIGNGGGKTLEAMSRDSGESWKTIQRYVWLARLQDNLLEMVDLEELSFTAGVAISFLSLEEQKWVYQVIQVMDCKVSQKMADSLKKLSQERKLNYQQVHDILVKKKRLSRTFTIREKRIREFFPASYSSQQIEEVVYQLLEEWKLKQQKGNENEPEYIEGHKQGDEKL